MKESTLKIVLPAATLALAGAAIYWFSSPRGSRDTGPPPPLASVVPPGMTGKAAPLSAVADKGTHPAAERPQAPVEPVAAGALVRRKSSYEVADERNPFWPIGWKPAVKSSENGAAPAISPTAFALTSVTIGAERKFVILNRKILQEGQQFALNVGQHLYQLTVEAVRDGSVVLAYDGGEVTVPLSRR